jgi:hypothetical protein
MLNKIETKTLIISYRNGLLEAFSKIPQNDRARK